MGFISLSPISLSPDSSGAETRGDNNATNTLMGLCGTNYSPFLTCLLKSHHEHFLPSCELPKGKDGPGESPAHTRLGMRGSQRRGCLTPDPVRSPDLVNRHTCLCLHSSLTEGLYSELQNKTSTKVTGFQDTSAGV